MKIAYVSAAVDKNICTFHEAFRKGLKAYFDVRFFGEGYDGYNPNLKTYTEIINYLFPDGDADLLFADEIALSPNYSELRFLHEGITDVKIPKTFILSDYWNITDNYRDKFPEWVERNQVDFILTQYPGPAKIYANTSIGKKILWNPICIDPAVNNDWRMEKVYDVGFLGAGVLHHHPAYPDRNKMHNIINSDKSLRYLTTNHPGYEVKSHNEPLVGKNFSKLINSCKLHIVEPSIYKNPFGKFFETMASHTLLLAVEPMGANELDLIDGVTYVKITPETVLDKIHYYLAHPKEAEEIAGNGYRVAMRYHTCYHRASDLYDVFSKFLKGNEVINFEAIDLLDPINASVPGIAGSKEKGYLANSSLLKSDPISEKIFMAEELMDNGMLKQAETILQMVIALDKFNLAALNDLSVIAMLNKEWKVAHNLILSVLEIDSKNEIAKDNLKFCVNNL